MLKSAEYQCYKAIKARTKIIENIEQKRQASAPVVFLSLQKSRRNDSLCRETFLKETKKETKTEAKKETEKQKEQRRKRIAREREVHK